MQYIELAGIGTLKSLELGNHTLVHDAAGAFYYDFILAYSLTSNLTFTQTARTIGALAAAAGTVTSSGLNDTFSGFAGLIGGSGNDVFYTFTDGNDVIPTAGNVRVDGGGGFNTLVELASSVNTTIGNYQLYNVQEVVLGGGTNTISVGFAYSVPGITPQLKNDFIYLYGGGSGSINTMTLGIGGGYEFSTGGTNHMFGETDSLAVSFAATTTDVFIGGIGTSDMHGGLGNNVYYTGATDTVAGAGTYNTDVLLAQNVTLIYGTNITKVQQVILNGGSNSVDMTGSTDFVYLYGGSGTNTMKLGTGGGYELSTGGVNHMFGAASGSGTDVFVGGVGTSDMHGGTGSNLYYVGANDTVIGSTVAGSYNTLLEIASGVSLTLGSASLKNVQQYIFYTGNNSLNASSAISQIIVYGGTGNDTFKGGSGNDYFWGGAGANTFQFGAGFGQDTIKDWTAGTGNIIDLTALAGSGVHSLANITQTIAGGDDTITVGTSTITLSGVATALAASSFHFA